MIPIYCESNRINFKEKEVRVNSSRSKSLKLENEALGPRKQGQLQNQTSKRKQEAAQTTLKTDTIFYSETYNLIPTYLRDGT